MDEALADGRGVLSDRSVEGRQDLLVDQPRVLVAMGWGHWASRLVAPS
jgi:hypothetical protein